MYVISLKILRFEKIFPRLLSSSNATYMSFFDFNFSYIFKGYLNKGEKYSAHIYALCVITLLLCCNILSVVFISISDNYLKSKAFKSHIIIAFTILISINAFYFLKNGRHLKMAAQYQELNSERKRKGKTFFWVYFISTIILLVLSMVYKRHNM